MMWWLLAGFVALFAALVWLVYKWIARQMLDAYVNGCTGDCEQGRRCDCEEKEDE